jgi:pimeloyl-ACP methyl ester carboxylesterase
LPLLEKIVRTAPEAVTHPAPPIEECEARIAGYRMRYLRAGNGPPLVLIHGLLGYSFSWRFNIPALAERFTVYAPDVIGMGFSERPRNLDCTLHGCSGRVFEFIEQLGVQSLNLLGTSHGGGIACAVAAKAAERKRPHIEKLVLVSAVNPWSHGARKRLTILSNPLAAEVFRRCWRYTRRVHSYFLRRMYGDPARITAGTLNGYGAGLAQPHTADYGLAVVKSWNDDLRHLREIYPRLQGMPTLLVWGDRDTAVSPDSAYELQRALPDSQLVMMPGIGHLPYEECPDEFNRVLLGFLTRE